MNNYLYQHYKGKYRVLADYDLDTNDFPRNETGAIDSDFNDFYIPGKKSVQIRHAGNDNLGCYVFGTGMGNSILKAIYQKEVGKEPPKKIETTANKMIELGLINEITFYDGELLFIFKAKHLDDWAKIFKLKTSGASISPLSQKNLPKSDYKIPIKDEEKYSDLLSGINQPFEKAKIVRTATQRIQSKFTKKQQEEMRKLCMKSKQYIHYIGKWEDLLNEIEKEMNNEK